LLAFLPSSNRQPPPAVVPTDDPQRRCEKLLELVPTNERKPYDMRRVIAGWGR
jgi:acetyl-CoA carboxylase carboxyltransferase component